MGEQQAEFAERTVDILESKIDTLQETLYKEKLNYRIRLIKLILYQNDQYMKILVYNSAYIGICCILCALNAFTMPIFVNCDQRGISEQLDKTLNIMMSM